MKTADGMSMIATRRATRKLAALEAGTLQSLAGRCRSAPSVHGFNGIVLIQEDLGTLSLAKAFQNMQPRHVGALLDGAISSLVELHQGADSSRLDHRMPLIGTDENWIIGILDQPQVLGNYLKLPAPKFDTRQLFDLLVVTIPRFIKWDTSPHSAIVAPDGKISWFDFSTCGARNPSDDLIWLIGDESLPDLDGAEIKIVDKWLPAFAGGRSLESCRTYLFGFLTLHLTYRLARLFTKKGERPWDSPELAAYCGIGLRGAAERLITRSRRYAAMSPMTEPLVPWFVKIGQNL